MNMKHCDPVFLLETVDGDPNIFGMLAEIFFRDIGVQFSSLKFAAETDDLQALRDHSHALKGTVGPFAPLRLLKMLQQLEDECRQMRCHCDAQRLVTVRDELRAVAAEVRLFMATL